jgi:hypothetical protein
MVILLRCDFIISCTDSFCAHSFYLWWSACQDLTLIIIDPARVRAQCACMHAFLHFISGCEWTPHQSIFTRKLYVLVEGWENQSLWMVKLNYVFFWVERWNNPFSWMNCHVLVGQDCFTFLCSFASLTLPAICWWTTRHIQQVSCHRKFFLFPKNSMQTSNWGCHLFFLIKIKYFNFRVFWYAVVIMFIYIYIYIQ